MREGGRGCDGRHASNFIEKHRKAEKEGENGRERGRGDIGGDIFFLETLIWRYLVVLGEEMPKS